MNMRNITSLSEQDKIIYIEEISNEVQKLKKKLTYIGSQITNASKKYSNSKQMTNLVMEPVAKNKFKRDTSKYKRKMDKYRAELIGLEEELDTLLDIKKSLATPKEQL